MPRRTWTEDEDQAGRKMWRSGNPAWAIGLAFGRSRFSIIGRADREGWGKHPHPQGAGMPGKGYERFLSTAERKTAR